MNILLLGIIIVKEIARLLLRNKIFTILPIPYYLLHIVADFIHESRDIRVKLLLIIIGICPASRLRVPGVNKINVEKLKLNF